MVKVQKNIQRNPMLGMLNIRAPSGDFILGSSVAAATSLYEKSMCRSVCFSSFEREELVKVIPQPQIDLLQLNNQINTLSSQINKLTTAIEQLNKVINPPVQQFLIEDIEFDRAKELVVDYLKENKTASLSELAETLKIDLRMLCDIVGELQEKGLITENE